MIKTFASQGFKCIENNTRSIDVNCRTNPYTGWCYFHRNQCNEELAKLSEKYSVVSDIKKISLQEYYSELEQSKIVLSPFGWGEICPKDFEAVMKGCLLIKPSVEHLDTLINFHIPYKTYVPVKWDLSDLNKKIEYYLKNNKEREDIVKCASDKYNHYFSDDIFIEYFNKILHSTLSDKQKIE